MKKLMMFLLIQFLNAPLVSAQTDTLNDFFPLHIGNYFDFEYLSVEKEYDMLFPILITTDSGTVRYDILSMVDEDSVFEWGIKEKATILRSIDTTWNGIGVDTVYDISSDITYFLKERKDLLHTIIFNPRLEILQSPTRWYTFSGIVYGKYLHRFSTEDSLFYINQYINSGFYWCWDSLMFRKNLGLQNAKSLFEKGPNTSYNYQWQASLLNYNIITSIEGANNFVLPKEFLLQQNYPNPFNPSTKISWQSPVSGWQTLKVYDVLGNEVATLVNEYKSAGSYEIEFNPSSSVYFYRLKAGDYVETKKMILLK